KVKIFQGRFVAFLPSCEIWAHCNIGNHAPPRIKKQYIYKNHLLPLLLLLPLRNILFFGFSCAVIAFFFRFPALDSVKKPPFGGSLYQSSSSGSMIK
ncbi:TPA: hypothetical protein ACLRJ5_001629, partial [Neisseria meningitidis]